MFKPGDKVVCVDNHRIANIAQMYQKFTICSVSENGEFISIHENHAPGLVPSRFKIDISEQRKLKLQKLCSKQEIE